MHDVFILTVNHKFSARNMAPFRPLQVHWGAAMCGNHIHSLYKHLITPYVNNNVNYCIYLWLMILNLTRN